MIPEPASGMMLLLSSCGIAFLRKKECDAVSSRNPCLDRPFWDGVGAQAAPLLVIIDTGVCASQVTVDEAPLSKALASDGEKIFSYDFVSSIQGFADETGHGTHVSGIVWSELIARTPEHPPG